MGSENIGPRFNSHGAERRKAATVGEGDHKCPMKMRFAERLAQSR
jgi:hypothetical protein